jgi:hypothetical protein
MILKRLINFSIISFISVTSFGQTNDLWLKGGVNFANVSYNNGGEVDDANMLTSFHVGFMGDINLAKVLAIQPGILFTGKGSKIQSGKPNDNFYYKATANPLYIEIPVNLAIKLPLASSKSNFFLARGHILLLAWLVKGKLKAMTLLFHTTVRRISNTVMMTQLLLIMKKAQVLE